MKKILSAIALFSIVILTGCFETTEEINLNEDGTGTYSTTNDLSALIGLAKQMGGASELEKAPTQQIDSTFSLANQADSISNLTAEEKNLIKKGVANVKLNVKEEKFITNVKIPFNSFSEITSCNKLSAKIMAESMKGQLGGAGMAGTDQMPEQSSLDDYFTIEYKKGNIKRKLNKEKYAHAEDDDYLKSMKEAGAMGLAMKTNYIINLPRPAKKVEGSGIVLSADKKKVTLSVTIDDFFDDPSKLEFDIEY